MPQSTITSKFQTTVPKEIRQKLGLAPRDLLCWEIVGQDVRVVPARRGFLDRRGSVQVGAGSAVEDVRLARSRRGSEGS